MTRLHAIAPVLALTGALLALAGCAGPQGPEAQPTVLDCQAGAPSLTPGAGSHEAPVPGRVPEGFEPVAAVRCLQLDTVQDSVGTWSAVTTERLEGDLRPLLAALSQADDPRWLGPCSAIGQIMPPLWLVDADGIAIPVRYPVDGCGLVKPAAPAALDGLTVTDRTSEKGELFESRAAADSGCPTSWSLWNPVIYRTDGAGSPAPRHGETTPPPGSLPVIPVEPPRLSPTRDIEALQLCRYSATTPDVGPAIGVQVVGKPVGQFVDARRLARADTLLILEEAPGTPQDCTLDATQFAALFPVVDGKVTGVPITVELDGCQRISRPGEPWTPAPTAILALLSWSLSIR